MIIKSIDKSKTLKLAEVEAFITATHPEIKISYDSITVHDPNNISGNNARVVQFSLVDATGMKMYEYSGWLMVNGYNTGGTGGFLKSIFKTNRSGISESCLNVCREVSAKFECKMFKGGV